MLVSKLFRWEEIYKDLRNNILNDVYQEYLPTENQLVIKYKTSRETIRKIYTKLENENLIISIKSKGRLKRHRSQDFKFQSFREMYANSENSNYVIIDKNDSIISLFVKRYDLDKTLIIVEESTIYLENLSTDNINEKMFNDFGILAILKKFSKNNISGANKKITLENSNKMICNLLNTKNYILNDCIVFDEYENVLERSKNYYHPIFFEYSFYEKI